MFRNRLSALLLVAALALPHAAAAPVAAQALAEAPAASRWADAIAQGRATVAAVMAEHGIPGLSVAVLVDGAVVWSEGFGYANIEHRVPVTPLTRLRIGSVSKPVTAAALGKLVEQGRLDLDAPVQRYVPSFPEKRWPITTRQLAGHLPSTVDPGREVDDIRLREIAQELGHGDVRADRDVVQDGKAERQLRLAARLEGLPLEPVPAERRLWMGDVDRERQDPSLAGGGQ